MLNRNYQNLVPVASLLVYLAVLPLNSLAADEADTVSSLRDAFTKGQADLQLRYRFEGVEEDNDKKNAEASTLKSRFSYQTAGYNGFKAQIEVDNVTDVLSEDFDSTRNGNTEFSKVVDPDGTAVNQAWIAYSGIYNTNAKLGRQRINLDNQRFIGGVGWRQNEQTYDGFTVANTGVKDLTAVYNYVDQVNRIFGPKSGSPPKQLDTAAHLVNINYAGLPFGTLTGYGYFLDIDEAAALSTRTLGARLTGSAKLNEDLSIPYTAEFAQQEDYEDNPASYTVAYYGLEGGLQGKSWTVKAGLEVLEGDLDKGVSFATPLATLHKFQGWADKFLSTPTAGIEDVYLSGSVQVPVINSKLTVAYHDFQANDSGAEWGTELDVSLARKFGKHLTGLLKFADYDADEHSVDTQKIWLQLQFNL